MSFGYKDRYPFGKFLTFGMILLDVINKDYKQEKIFQRDEFGLMQK